MSSTLTIICLRSDRCSADISQNAGLGMKLWRRSLIQTAIQVNLLYVHICHAKHPDSSPLVYPSCCLVSLPLLLAFSHFLTSNKVRPSQWVDLVAYIPSLLLMVVILAITTVGYGEITPRSFLGRLITLPILVCGLLLITLPSFVLGREFSLVWERMTSNQVHPVQCHRSISISFDYLFHH